MPVNTRISKRRKSDAPPRYDQEVPSFLENSPYFLPLSEEAESRNDADRYRPPHRPSLRQILQSRLVRRSILAAVFFITILVYLRSEASARIYMNLGRLGLVPGGGARCLYDTSKLATIPLDTEAGAAIDWRANAYATYVTSPEYLCNAVMIFESLARLESKAARILLYPNTDQFSPSDGLGAVENRRLLVKARDEYGVNLVPVKIWRKDFSDDEWQDSYTKLLVFNQTQYERILFLDSDATVLAPMDELFLLPPCRAAMPRAYWLQNPLLGSHIMLIQPSASEFARVEKAVEKAGSGTYDMEVMNNLYGNDCVVLPHQQYALLTGEFRKENHEAYLETGSGWEWDPEKIFSRAKFVHFSDYPMPKPWEHITKVEVERNQPPCDESGDCRAKEVWLGLYRDFRDRRESVCELELP